MIGYIQDIRKHYELLTPKIMQSGEERGASCWVSPYGIVNWTSLFSPIEYMAWQDIRSYGKVPMYPQYPVGKYFVDFGNPYTMLAIECDGAEYHKDPERDLKRDKVLYDIGWRVYRISGSDCNRATSDEYFNIEYISERQKEEVLKEFYHKTIEGLLTALGVHFFGFPICEHSGGEYVDFESDLIKECLDSRVSLKNITHCIY